MLGELLIDGVLHEVHALLGVSLDGIEGTDPLIDFVFVSALGLHDHKESFILNLTVDGIHYFGQVDHQLDLCLECIDFLVFDDAAEGVTHDGDQHVKHS